MTRSWEEEVVMGLEDCGRGLEEGRECRGECVPYRDWCTQGTRVRPRHTVERAKFLKWHR